MKNFRFTHGTELMGCDRKIGPFDCCSVVQGDCIELLGMLDSGLIAAVITDPPYGVGYAKWDSDIPNLKWLALARSVAHVTLFTPGNGSQYRYPAPDWTLSWSRPGSVQRAAGGGFSHWDPILVYGKNPFDVDCKVFNPQTGAGDIGHPCPKPLAVMEWLVSGSTDVGDTVIDPFAGSGTTLVAAKKLSRHFLGFEISPEYCEIARKRLAAIDAQPSLFAPKPVQEGLFCKPCNVELQDIAIPIHMNAGHEVEVRQK